MEGILSRPVQPSPSSTGNGRSGFDRGEVSLSIGSLSFRRLAFLMAIGCGSRLWVRLQGTHCHLGRSPPVRLRPGCFASAHGNPCLSTGRRGVGARSGPWKTLPKAHGSVHRKSPHRKRPLRRNPRHDRRPLVSLPSLTLAPDASPASCEAYTPQAGYGRGAQNLKTRGFSVHAGNSRNPCKRLRIWP